MFIATVVTQNSHKLRRSGTCQAIEEVDRKVLRSSAAKEKNIDCGL